MHPDLKVLLVCSQQLIREGLRLLMQQDEDLTIVGVAPDVPSALDLALERRPDVTLVCLDSPSSAIFEGEQRLFLAKPVLPVVIIAPDPPITQVQAWVEAGALGVLPLSAEPEELFRILYAAGRGERTLHPALARRLIVHLAGAKTGPPHLSLTNLTSREREVLVHLAQGAGDKDIAQALFISVRTVQTHLAHIYEKLGVHSRTELTLLAIRAGWVELPAAEAYASTSP